MNRIRVVNRSRGTLLGNRILLVDSWLGRLRGFLGRPEPRRGEGILLVPCSAVHMYGMKFPLDLVFLNGDGIAVEIVRNLQPWERTKRVGEARSVLEVSRGTIDSTATEVGDRLVWTAPEPVITAPHRLDGILGSRGPGSPREAKVDHSASEPTRKPRS